MSDKKRKNKRSNKELEKVTGSKAQSSSEEGSLGEGLNINPNPLWSRFLLNKTKT